MSGSREIGRSRIRFYFGTVTSRFGLDLDGVEAVMYLVEEIFHSHHKVVLLKNRLDLRVKVQIIGKTYRLTWDARVFLLVGDPVQCAGAMIARAEDHVRMEY